MITNNNNTIVPEKNTNNFEAARGTSVVIVFLRVCNVQLMVQDLIRSIIDSL